MSSLLFELALAAALAIIPARIAAAKGRSFRLWWFYGWMLLIVAIPHALLLRPLPEREAEPDTQAAAPIDGPEMADCPTCHERIRAGTPMCPFCGMLTPAG